MVIPLSGNLDSPTESRANFIGRVQEQRQFRVALSGLLAHQRRWRDLAYMQGVDFNPDQAPGDDTYARIFLLHGIGGIGKSWLTRRCLTLAEEQAADPPILTLYDDVSLGPPVLEPAHLLERLTDQLNQAGYEADLTAYHQALADIPGVAERVAIYQAESRERWEKARHLAAGLLTQETKTYGPRPAAPPPTEAAITARAYSLLLEDMQKEAKLTSAEATLFRQPAVVQAAKLVSALNRIARRRPLVIALDNLEIVVSLESFIRDALVLSTHNAPLIWILSGRHNLADERLVEIEGEKRDYKGYRDLLGVNPPVVWDMSIFGDADLHDYLTAEAGRRNVTLKIDDDLIDAVKGTSSGVPLVVEMVADALFSMKREDFLRNFALDDKTLLPTGRLEQITTRFLRYCMQREDDLERVHGLALLRKDADEAAMAAVWALLPGGITAPEILQELRSRYAFVLPGGLHDAIYDFVRRQLLTLRDYREVRVRLGRRAATHYQAEYDHLTAALPDDPSLRVRDPRWQRVTRDLVNALLWHDPDEAVRFLLPRFVEGLGYDRPFAEGLLLQADEFLGEAASPINRPYANLLRQLRVGLRDIGYYDEPGAAVGKMVDNLLQTPDLDPLHLGVLRLWQGDWLAQERRYPEALTAYLSAAENLPESAASLRKQLGRAFYRLSSAFLWPESALETVPSAPGLQAAEQATLLDPANADAWFNLGAALEHLEREAEAIDAYQRAIALEPRPIAYNGLGDVLTTLGRYDEASAAYHQALDMNPDLPWPYHNLGLLHEHRGEYAAAIPLYRQALERHQRDKDKAITWDNLGNVYAAQGEVEEAIAAYRWATILNSRYAPPWHGLGDIYSAQSRDEEALKAYLKAIDLDPTAPWPHNNLALVYERRGEYQQAIRSYQQALEHHTDDRGRSISWRNLGDVYRALGRHDEAIAVYQRAARLEPQDARPHNSLGDLYATLGQTDAAIAAHRQAIALNPAYTASHNSLGHLYSAAGRNEEAIAAYRRVIELDPANAWAYNNLAFLLANQGQTEPALSLYQQAIERHQRDKDRAISWNNLGQLYENLANEAEAVTAYHHAVELDPTLAWPYHTLGLIYRRQGDNEAALTAFQQAIERHEQAADQALAWNEVGDIYLAQERRLEAESAYQQAAVLDDTLAPPWNSLGDLHLAAGRLAEAEASYRRANQLDPILAWPYHRLARLAAGRSETAAAIPLYQQAIARHPAAPQQAIAWDDLGEAYRALGRLDEAEAAFRQANRLDPTYAWPYHHLGLILVVEGHLAQAESYFGQAIERQPRDSDRAAAWYQLGEIYRLQNRPAPAIEAYQQAAALDPAVAAPWRSLGDVQRGLGQVDAAMTAYRQAIGLEPAEPWPYHNLGLLHARRSEYEAAIIRFQQALERHRADPSRATSWQHLGQVYQTLARPPEAIKAFRQAGALDPTYALPWHALGEVYRSLGRREEALSAFQRAAELDPTYAATWFNLGDLYRETARPNEAIAAYRRTVALDSANAWAYHHLGDLLAAQNDPVALDYYRQATQHHPDDTDRALAWSSLGDTYRVLNRRDEAAEAYLQASRFNPAYPWPYHHLGGIYEQRGELEAALDCYQQAITHHTQITEQAILWERVGRINQTLGRWAESALAYRQTVALNPANAPAWANQGDVCRRLNRPDEAITAYQRAIELDPAPAWPYHHLGLIYEERGEAEAALTRFRQAIERHSRSQDQAVAWNHLGDIYLRQEQLESAREAYRQAIRLDPAYAHPWRSMGEICRRLNQPDEAMTAYRQAIQLDPAPAWPYHRLGELHASRKEHDPAVAYFRQAIERYEAGPDQAQAWTALGQVYQELNELRAAAEAYQQANQADPTAPWPYHRLGLLAEQRGEYESAQTLFNQALEQHDPQEPRRSESWQHLGNTAVALGDLEAAAQAYQQAGVADPHNAAACNSLGDVYVVQGRHEEAIEAYQQATVLDERTALPWNGLGSVYVKLGQYDEAAAAYQQALKLEPKAAWLHRNLALVYEQQHNYEAALEAYQQTLARYTDERDKAVVWYYIGQVQRILGHPDEAIQAYQQASQLDPYYALPWNGLGSVYSAQSQLEEAVKAYRRAIEIDPHYAWPYHNLGLLAEGQEKHEAAIAFYEQAIVSHRDDRERAQSWQRLGNVYQAMGHYERAIVVYRRAIALDPTSALPWNSLGDVYNDLNQHDAAIRAYQKAIQLDPDYTWPYNNLGFMYEKLGRHEQAITLYRQVIERRPQQADTAISWNNLGNVYTALSQPDKAMAAYRQAIELDPTYTWPYHNLGAIYEQRGQAELALALYQQAARRYRQKTALPVQG